MGRRQDSNPFYRDRFSGFERLAGDLPLIGDRRDILETNHLFKSVDATLDVKGLPQSGTGQATLFSGENAAKEIDKHFGPYPHSGIKHLLEDHSLFLKAQQHGKRCHFINAYPDVFFKKARKRNRWSCTTLMSRSASISLNSARDVNEGKAITAGITQKAWRNRLQINVPIIEPEEAADRLINQSVEYDLILHEYYLTDKAGHGQDMEEASYYIRIYDRFLKRLIVRKPSETTIVFSSDHGNVEDLSVKTHTVNPVPLACVGPGAAVFKTATTIADVTPGIIKVLTESSN
ncbi:alkaline phosphatase family protein [Fodinibius sediminis]|uniref:alkaline phosphatase family protein n=1 Tax=Fodinibius sediminis TaxID=1214077 RepID=UPI001FE8DE7F|nr:alkaline phosphatase family protein [Fodinibius sediminis]